MKLTCEDLVDLLVDYVGGGLEAAQVQAFKDHLCGCKSCDQSVALYQITITVTRALPKVGPLPDGVEARLRAAVATAPADAVG